MIEVSGMPGKPGVDSGLTRRDATLRLAIPMGHWPTVWLMLDATSSPVRPWKLPRARTEAEVTKLRKEFAEAVMGRL